MSYANVVRRNWNENRLYSVLVELTYRCNLDCHFCYNDADLVGAPLSTEQYFTFFRDLAAIGVLELTLSGGEPLAHRAFFELGAEAKALGFVVRVKSNGHALRGKLLQRLIKEVDPFMVEVSLHGAKAATHDRQTRVPGSFQRLIHNVREMRSAGLRVRMNSTLTRWNEDELDVMYRLAERLDVTLKVDPQVTPRDNGDQSPLTLLASREGLQRLISIQAEQQTTEAATAASLRVVETGKHCGAGSATVTVDPYGTVYPCVQWRRAVGNLHQQSIRDIWHRSESLETVRKRSSEVHTALAGIEDNAASIGFCPGLAEMSTGNATTVYPEAALRLALRQKTGKSIASAVESDHDR